MTQTGMRMLHSDFTLLICMLTPDIYEPGPLCALPLKTERNVQYRAVQRSVWGQHSPSWRPSTLL